VVSNATFRKDKSHGNDNEEESNIVKVAFAEEANYCWKEEVQCEAADETEVALHTGNDEEGQDVQLSESVSAQCCEARWPYGHP
jgi:hypothetical protein